jgi:hypothetical protein
MHSEIESAARMLYENIKADINNASTRLEHVRLTALAQEAANLLTEIEKLDGLDLTASSDCQDF